MAVAIAINFNDEKRALSNRAAQHTKAQSQWDMAYYYNSKKVGAWFAYSCCFFSAWHAIALRINYSASDHNQFNPSCEWTFSIETTISYQIKMKMVFFYVWNEVKSGWNEDINSFKLDLYDANHFFLINESSRVHITSETLFCSADMYKGGLIRTLFNVPWLFINNE